MTMLIEDSDSLLRPFRVTNAHALVVAAMVPAVAAAPIFLQPASSGVRSA